jgi:hypothetical protein
MLQLLHFLGRFSNYKQISQTCHKVLNYNRKWSFSNKNNPILNFINMKNFRKLGRLKANVTQVVIRTVAPDTLPMHPNSRPSAKSFSAVAKKVILALFLANARRNTRSLRTSDRHYPQHKPTKESIFWRGFLHQNHQNISVILTWQPHT